MRIAAPVAAAALWFLNAGRSLNAGRFLNPELLTHCRAGAGLPPTWIGVGDSELFHDECCTPLQGASEPVIQEPTRPLTDPPTLRMEAGHRPAAG